MMQDIPRQELSLVILLKDYSSIMHSKKNHGYSIVETSMYGSYNIMQDHLYIFPRKFSDFQHMILKLYYCLDLTRLLCKISCASFQEKSFQYMFLKLSIVCMHSKKNHGYSIVETSMYGSYKIMQDHLYIFPRKFSDFQHMILKFYYCLDLTRLLCKISCASFQEKSFQYMFLKLSIVWILQDNV